MLKKRNNVNNPIYKPDKCQMGTCWAKEAVQCNSEYHSRDYMVPQVKSCWNRKNAIMPSNHSTAVINTNNIFLSAPCLGGDVSNMAICTVLAADQPGMGLPLVSPTPHTCTPIKHLNFGELLCNQQPESCYNNMYYEPECGGLIFEPFLPGSLNLRWNYLFSYMSWFFLRFKQCNVFLYVL